MKDTFYIKGTKTVYARDYRPVVHHAIRKSLLGGETRLTASELVDHIDLTPIPKQP